MAPSQEPPIRNTITSVQFSLYTSSELRSLSCCEILNPTAYDNLGNPLPSGCYDPHMGPTSRQDGPCVTCGKDFEDCSGHCGHVELCMPVYNVLMFPGLARLMKAKCMCCHGFRAGAFREKVAETKLKLIEVGR